MKKFVAIYLGSAEGLAEWKATDEEKRKEREKAGMEGWMKWAKDNEASILDLGSPLGKTKRMDAKGIADTKNEITAYTIVQAESHEAAAELFANHPHFMIFPGQSVGSWNVCRYRKCRFTSVWNRTIQTSARCTSENESARSRWPTSRWIIRSVKNR